MKKLLGEYSQIIGYTVTGLVFGLAFFLLFINFYHYQEISATMDRPEYATTLYNKLVDNNNKVTNNIQAYNVNTYSGAEDRYDMMSIQSRLTICTRNFNDEEMLRLLQKEKLTMLDVYHLSTKFQSQIVNECLVKQLYSLTTANKDNSQYDSPSLKLVAPLLKVEMDGLLDKVKFVTNYLENNSNYYYSTQGARAGVFDTVKDSYYEILSAYEEASDFVLELSNWFATVTGGVV